MSIRRIVPLAIFMVLITVIAEAKKVKGKIYYSNNTEKDVTFKIPMGIFGASPVFQKLHYKVVYFDESGTKKTLTADDAIEIRFEVNGEEIRMLSRSKTEMMDRLFSDSRRVFLKLEKEGAVSLFSFYSTQTNPGAGPNGAVTVSVSIQFMLQKGKYGALKTPRTVYFRKDMVEYFNDCPELVEKIEDKELRRSDLIAIVNYYNNNCVR